MTEEEREDTISKEDYFSMSMFFLIIVIVFLIVYAVFLENRYNEIALRYNEISEVCEYAKIIR